MEAIFLLRPMGAANGLLSAARSIVLESGMAARVGREVYQKALDILFKTKQSHLRTSKKPLRTSERRILSEFLATGGRFGGIDCHAALYPETIAGVILTLSLGIEESLLD
jgi:hypothetical protein